MTEIDNKLGYEYQIDGEGDRVEICRGEIWRGRDLEGERFEGGEIWRRRDQRTD